MRPSTAIPSPDGIVSLAFEFGPQNRFAMLRREHMRIKICQPLFTLVGQAQVTERGLNILY